MPIVMARATTDNTSDPPSLDDVKVNDHNGDDDTPSVKNEDNFSSDNADNDDDDNALNFWQRRSVGMANRPWTHCCTSLVLALVLGIGGMIAGGFQVAVDGAGWESRGTAIADRHMQFMLIDVHADALLQSDDSTSDALWTDLTTNKQENFYADDDDEDRRLEEMTLVDTTATRPFFDAGVSLRPGDSNPQRNRELPFTFSESLNRRLQAVAATGILDGCDTSWYTSGDIFDEERLWPIWRLKANADTASFFQGNVLQELCEQEAMTQRYLEENGLCFGCSSSGGGDQKNRCLQPYSPVLYARLIVEDGMTLDCPALAQAWDVYKDSIEQALVQCVVDLKADYNPDRDGMDFPDSCPEGFSPVLLDELYDTTQRVQYTSSIFATKYDDIDELYEAADKYARGAEHIRGAYDTQDEDFVNLSLDAQLGVDMSLALASAFITTIAMVIHTRSLFLALTGLLQITLSFPLAYAVYTFPGQLVFFPFLNFIGESLLRRR